MIKSQNISLTDWALLILLSLLWGGSFFFVGVVVAELPTFTIVALRLSLAALTLLLFCKFTGNPMPTDPTIWIAFILMGILNNAIPHSLIVWGQGSIPSGLASILNATTPLFTVVFAHILTSDEKLTPARISGVLLGIIGVIVLLGYDPTDQASLPLLPQLAVLAAASSYAVASIFARRFKRYSVTPMQTATGQLVGSSLCIVPAALIIDAPWTLQMPSPLSIAALLGLAILSTSLAYMIYFRILVSSGATVVSLVTFLIPPSAVLLGILFLNETLRLNHLAGLALIAAGLAAIDGRIFRRTP